MDFLTRFVRELDRMDERGRVRRERDLRFVQRWFPLAWKGFIATYASYAVLGMVGWRMPKEPERCPFPPAAAEAALSPDGTAHVLTRTPKAVCWWTVSEDGDQELVRLFHIEADATVELTWDDIVGQLRLKSRAPHSYVDQIWLDPVEWGSAR